MFLKFLFRSSFQKKYKIFNPKNLRSILENKINRWQIIDIRTSIEFKQSHLKDSINIPVISSKYKIFKKINRLKKILIINSNYRSNLDIYNLLFSKKLDVYLFYGNFENDILNNPILKSYIYIENKTQ